MGDGILIEVALVAALIVLNGFFSGSEMAVITAPRGRVAALAEAGDRRARALLRLRADPDRFLATVQIGVTLVGTLSAAVGGAAAVEVLEPALASVLGSRAPLLAEPLAVTLVVGVLSFVSLVVGELVPKALAVRNAERLSLAVARPIEALSRWSGAVVTLLTVSSRAVLRLLGQTGTSSNPFHTVEDLHAMVSEMAEQGMIAPELLKGAIAFQDREVHEVMTPRPRVTSLPLGASLAEATRIAIESGFSRFPVIDRELDHVLAVVHARDIFEAALRARPVDMGALFREPFFVPGGKSAHTLLQEMRREQRHIAFVVDEHGSVRGLVTLEDLIEVIVGEIDDERDEPVPRVMTLAPGTLEAEGSLPVHDLNAEHGLDLPESAEYVTLAGLLLARLGALARGGETVEAGNYRLTVRAVEQHRISRVRVERLEAPPASGRDEGPKG